MPSPNATDRSGHTTDPGVCARCAAVGTTCCHVPVGSEEYCFPLSTSEWERIVSYCAEEGGFAEEPNTTPFVDTLKRLFPRDCKKLDALFPEHGTHMRLGSRPDGHCMFLTSQGCRLPREVRPWYCLLFPFWVRGSMLTMFTAAGCLICRETGTVKEALDLLDMSDKDVRTIFGRLRLAWGLDPEDDILEEAAGSPKDASPDSSDPGLPSV